MRSMARRANHIRIIRRRHACLHRKAGACAGANDRWQTIIGLKRRVQSIWLAGLQNQFGRGGCAIKIKILPNCQRGDLGIRPNRVIIRVIAV